MVLFRLILLFLIFCSFPNYALVKINASAGAFFSYFMFFLIVAYSLVKRRLEFVIEFIILGLFYFLISVAVDAQFAENFLVTFIKYFIFVIVGAKLIKDTNEFEMYIFLLFGAFSVFFELILGDNATGRYAGFYLNPNGAGFACIVGFCLSTALESKSLNIFGRVMFSISGLATFSRTFLLLWVLINIVSLFLNYKNVYGILVGIFVFILFLTYGNEFDLDTKRFNAFSSLLDGKLSNELEEDSRTETWSGYYERIYESPIWGNGYLSFSGRNSGQSTNRGDIQGVHNTYLMIFGESGFFVFSLFILIYKNFLMKGLKLFKVKPIIFLLTLPVMLFLLTSHNFFDNYMILFVSIWLFFQIEKSRFTNHSIPEVI